MKIKILTVVGARPQFIKTAAVSRQIAAHNKLRREPEIREIIVHTGQHYDESMSNIFFDELEIPKPYLNLGISSELHGAMTGRMLEGIEKVLLEELPDRVLVYGDTNSTLAGALAAAKLHIPISHVEAGLRSFNTKMPEEINRVLTDHISAQLFCPTQTAVDNLAREGIKNGVHLVGDVMFDVSLAYGELALKRSNILERLLLREKNYVLATCHRAENTDNTVRLGEIVRGIAALSEITPVVFPLHPRTKKRLGEHRMLDELKNVIVCDALSFLDMSRLEQGASAIVTDSGGMQKEAYFYGVPCLTLRDETEWPETLENCWNRLVGASAERLVVAYQALNQTAARPRGSHFGDGHAAEKVLAQLSKSSAET